jgi:CPA1 family monovalent cation:H+ antiporter
VLLTLTALFVYVNHRLLRLPPSIAVISVAPAFSLALLALGALGVPIDGPLRALVQKVHFDRTLLHGLLGFLLFAGALSVDLPGLRRNGVVLTTLSAVLSANEGGAEAVVVFGLLVQGTSLAWLLQKGAEVVPTSMSEHKESEDTGAFRRNTHR